MTGSTPGRASVRSRQMPRIARLLFARHLLFADVVELFFRAVTAVGRAVRQHAGDHFLVPVEALGLVERAEVVIEPEPLHALEDDPDRFLGRALAVRVLDAQDELAAHAAGVEPAIERGANAPDVQETRGAGGKTSDD